MIKSKLKWKLILSQQRLKHLFNIKYRYAFNEHTRPFMCEIISDQDCSEFLSKNKLKKKKSKISNKLYKCKKKLSEFYKTNWELS